MTKFALLLSVICAYLAAISAGKPGPSVTATKGAVWPQPQLQNVTNQYYVLRPNNFIFTPKTPYKSCNLFYDSLKRYYKIILDNNELVKQRTMYHGDRKFKKNWLEDKDFLGYVDQLTVDLAGPCDDKDYPSINMDETYKLWVSSEKIALEASTIWGILRGLETFSQLIYLADDGLTLRINVTVIKDFPRYKHRGLLIDTSRHFIPLDKILQTLDAMSYNKLNVLHWHIVDDQSFPYVSMKFRELSDFGAYNRYTKVYSPGDIQRVIDYAKERAVRVLPEFDTPGHTSSWGVSHPELLTPCQVFDTYGPMDPSKNSTFQFLNELFDEIRDVFKDDFIHLGGDEVDYSCWMQDANITTFMKKLNLTTYKALESYYIQKVVNIIEKLETKSIVWEEVFSNGVELPKETIVHVWKGDWRNTMKSVTAAGKQALLSTCWYLDNLSSGEDWKNFYYCDPNDFKGTPEEEKLVLGGEACMWGEVVNEYNIISRVWPRASATAEKLWSPSKEDYDLDEPASRLEEHTCRMNRRGIGAEPPNGPGYCD